jgi:hypothetical protein
VRWDHERRALAVSGERFSADIDDCNLLERRGVDHRHSVRTNALGVHVRGAGRRGRVVGSKHRHVRTRIVVRAERHELRWTCRNGNATRGADDSAGGGVNHRQHTNVAVSNPQLPLVRAQRAISGRRRTSDQLARGRNRSKPDRRWLRCRRGSEGDDTGWPGHRRRRSRWGVLLRAGQRADSHAQRDCACDCPSNGARPRCTSGLAAEPGVPASGRSAHSRVPQQRHHRQRIEPGGVV